MIDLCFLYTELADEPHYRAVAKKMVASVKFPARIVQFAKGESDAIPGAHCMVQGPNIVKENLTLCKIELFKEHLKSHIGGHVALCDADLIWQNSPEPLFEDNDFDIGLMWRQGNVVMPYCSAMVLARHGSEAAIHFAHKWYIYDMSLPEDLHGWYGDQISLTCMLGPGHKPNTTIVHDGVRIKFFDGAQTIYHIKAEGQKAPSESLALHYKGPRKHLMLAA